MALYCPLPGQYSAIARQETTRREEEGEATRRRRNKKEREVERKRLLSLLLFTLHQIVWNPDKHWGSERWRVGSPLHHSSPLFISSLSQSQSKTEAGHHWRPKLVIIEDQSWSSLKAEDRSWSSLKTKAGHHWRPKTEAWFKRRSRILKKNQGEEWVKSGEESRQLFTRTNTSHTTTYITSVKSEE